MKKKQKNTDCSDYYSMLPLAEHIRRGDVFSEQCPSRQVLKNTTSRWAVLVFVALLDGTHRFSELRRKIKGVSEKMLSQTLQQLEHNGFVKRTAYPVIPPHVEYELTALGEQAAKQVQGLADWIQQKMPQIMEAQMAYENKTANNL